MKNKINASYHAIYTLPIKRIAAIVFFAFALAAFFFVMFLRTYSIIYFLLFLPCLVYFILYFLPFMVNQSVQIADNKIIFTYRFGLKYEGIIADTLYQIIIKNEEYTHFRFLINKRSIQVTPLAYENGQELLLYLKKILKNKPIKVDILWKK